MNDATQAVTVQNGVFDLIAQSGVVVQLVLLSLVAASVLCWAIIVIKYKSMKMAHEQNQKFFDAFWKSKSLDAIYEKTQKYPKSAVCNVFKAGYRELKKLSQSERSNDGAQEVESINRALQRAANSQVAAMEKNVGYLATTASAAPFIGLFGTVWGIMNSFQSIGATGSANLAVVAPGIAEALIATATGLAAAIPAVIAYNHFINQIKRVVVDIDCFSQDFLNIIQRSMLGGKKR